MKVEEEEEEEGDKLMWCQVTIDAIFLVTASMYESR